MGKICLKHGDLPSVPNALAVWLQYLPLKSDLEEAVVVNEQLCLFLERCAQRPRELAKICSRGLVVLTCNSQGYGEHARCCQPALVQGVRGDGVRAQHRGGDISDTGENGAILGPNQGSITARPTRAVGRLGRSNRGWEVTSCSAANIARGARHFFP